MATKRSCELCLKTFASANSLYNHKMTHKRGKKYSCEQCNKLFIWTIISSFTVERSITSVHNVTHHLLKLAIWRLTCSHIQTRRSTSADNATFQPIRLSILEPISQYTVEKRSTHVNNATSRSVLLKPWRSTQRWKNLQILQIYLCYFFWAVLIFWLYMRKQTKTLCN